MNLEQLRTELETLGNVGYLAEENGGLYISLENVIEEQATLDSFNNIIDIYVIPTYPIIDAIAMEGGSIKAIYK